MTTQEDIERVYQFIWEYLLEHEVLAKPKHVAHALEMSHHQVMSCVEYLRADGRLRTTSLYPVAYDAYWRHHVRAEKVGEVPLAENIGMVHLDALPRQKHRGYRPQANKKASS